MNNKPRVGLPLLIVCLLASFGLNCLISAAGLAVASHICGYQLLTVANVAGFAAILTGLCVVMLAVLAIADDD